MNMLYNLSCYRHLKENATTKFVVILLAKGLLVSMVVFCFPGPLMNYSSSFGNGLMNDTSVFYSLAILLL